MAAISGKEKLLWSRDPFGDAHLPFYRTEKPQIVYIGPPPQGARPAREESNKFISIEFNSFQSGWLRISNGEFLFRDQD